MTITGDFLNKQQVAENRTKEYNQKMADAIKRVEIAVVMNDTKFINDFVSFVFEGINTNITISSNLQILAKNRLNRLLNNYGEYISTRLGALLVWYTLSYLSLEENKNTKEIEQLFYEIYLQIEDNRSFFFYLESFSAIFDKHTTLSMLESLLMAQGNTTITQSFVFKLVYVVISAKGISKDLAPLYPVLVQYFENAIKNKNDDLVFYLYQPLLFMYNSIHLRQEDFEYFNNTIEKKLEFYIDTRIMRKYKIKENKNKQTTHKIAFVIDRLVGTSIESVFYSFLQNLVKNTQNCDMYVYNLNWMEGNGSKIPQIEQMQSLGINYIDCHKKFVGDKNPVYSIVKKSIAIRKDMIANKIDTLVIQNGRAECNFLFTTRTAKKQIFWSHGNFAYDVNGIDKRICHFYNYEKRSATKHFDFEVFQNEIDSIKYNPKVDREQVNKIRENYPKECFVLGSIGRLIKIESDEYLETVAKIMEQNPNTIFLACGSGNQEKIKEKIKELNISDRFYFTGHIDAHIYAHIIDLYLDPFPLGGGEALMEYRGKGKPYVSLHTNEWSIGNEKYIKECIQNNKLDVLLKVSLYTQEYLQSISLTRYIIEENKNANIFSNIPIVLEIKEYIDVANRLLNDKRLCVKIGEEQRYLMFNKINNIKTRKSFLKAIND